MNIGLTTDLPVGESKDPLPHPARIAVIRYLIMKRRYPAALLFLFAIAIGTAQAQTPSPSPYWEARPRTYSPTPSPTPVPSRTYPPLPQGDPTAPPSTVVGTQPPDKDAPDSVAGPASTERRTELPGTMGHLSPLVIQSRIGEAERFLKSRP